MRLMEYQGKKIFSKFNIPVCTELLAFDVDSALDSAEAIGYPVVVKAQVLTGGRGKAGGVKLASCRQELIDAVNSIIGLSIKGETCECVLIAPKISVVKELYLGITVDTSSGSPVMLFSPSGGMDIEDIPRNEIGRLHLSPERTVEKYEIIDMLRKTALDTELIPKVCNVACSLAKLFCCADATTAEINPLVLTDEGNIVALDSKVVLDDAALPRQGDIAADIPDSSEPKGFVKLNGDIAVLTGGAGLGMGTMDLVSHFGGKVACFLDYGAGGYDMENPADMVRAIEFVLAPPEVRGVIINMFGGLASCVPLAQGVIDYCNKVKSPKALVLKLRGHEQEKAWALLDNSSVTYISEGTTEDAVRKLLAMLGEV